MSVESDQSRRPAVEGVLSGGDTSVTASTSSTRCSFLFGCVKVTGGTGLCSELASGNLVEAVAHAAQGHEPVSAELAAQVTNIDIDDIGSRIEVVAPDVAEELLS